MKKIPIGISDFEEIVTQGYYYVDKSKFILNIIESGSKATLIVRPRRFGKTLNMSMLKYFFEKKVESKAHLFDKLIIKKHHGVMAHVEQYPVIMLTFKAIKHDNWLSCYTSILGLIVNEYRRHGYLLEGATLVESEKKEYHSVINRTASTDLYENSLKNLSLYLHRYHGKKAVILVDEYDTPIHAGFINNYYDTIIGFMRTFLGEGLKDNINLEWAVVTGILRIAKESIFSGLNNLKICSLIDECNSDMFGFTHAELVAMLNYYNYASMLEDVARWYDGYSSGDIKIFNPWSINNFIDSHGRFDLYWANTSSNDIINKLLAQSDEAVKEDFEMLLSGVSIRKQINSNIIFQDLYDQTDVIWSFLLLSGYLTFDQLTFTEKEHSMANLSLPNYEVNRLFNQMIHLWFARGAYKKKYSEMLMYLTHGKIDEFVELFYNLVAQSFSQFDVSGNEPERFYHAFVLGMIVGMHDDYEIKSNRESGFGRYDVVLIPKKANNYGIIFEFKKVNARIKETLEQAVDRALNQIVEKNYTQELHVRGIAKIKLIGIAFDGKNVLIKHV